ncbi:glycoside hydrolase family 2 protein [Dysgonomonas sp. 520]|uniref:glycoside hydrolase family 2 protein n=1 Tax=Dysgonomonas sp. 520 TaxID=2302931 RepID=UPI0013D27139|nr:glycoside hydrolase family 2 TIM barrel-domain containing protein [Dysgonomonas sp. 520]NDW08574.1 beta-glucuronidase [Dysgonomonas sp. 520]
MKKVIFSMLCMCCIFPIKAQQAELVTNIAARSTFSLNGLWKTIVDPYEEGYYDSQRNPIKNTYGLDKAITDRTTLQEYDFATDKSLYVPGDWNTQRPDLFYYEGTVWYRKYFDYQVKNGKRVFLYFGAVNYEAIVFLNGKELGKHIGGFTPFNFEVTNLLKDGENSVVVKVDNKRIPEGVPTIITDWWNYGGITRDVKLIETPETFIRDYYLQLKKNENTKIEGWIQLDGINKNRPVTIEIPELKIKVTLQSDEKGFASFEQSAKPTYWSPENPKLYVVNIASGEESLKDEIGFRTIETKGSKILLNGKETFCRGISIHEEAPIRTGRAYSLDDAKILLGWAKEMGCNFVRLAHYPHNEHMVREAERLGLMVWAEIPVYWSIHYKNHDTYQNAENQLADMITRDKNRCNVIIWSLANETPRNKERFEFLSKLVQKARSMDSSRLISAAMEKVEKEKDVLTVEDDLSQLLDIVSFNQYVGWYDGLPEKCDRVKWVFPEDKPVFISEFGGGALYGMRGGMTDRFTEDFQEDLYKRSVKMLDQIPNLSGTTPWILMDFRSPRRLLPEIQDGFNRKGLISDKGQKKKAFYVMQKWYEELEKRYNNK